MMRDTHPTNDLPPDVIELLKANRKIEAVKRLRQSQGVSLTVAVQQVNAYLAGEPSPVNRKELSEEGGDFRWLFVVLIAVAGYLLYELFIESGA